MRWSIKHLLAICLIFCFQNNVAAENEEEVPAPEVQIGDSWTFQVIDGFTKDIVVLITQRVVEITPKEVSVRVEWKGRPNRSLWVFDHQWRLIDDSTRRYEPYRPDFQFPLGVGTQWEKDFQLTVYQTGTSFSNFTRAKVVGKENVTVPAGNFDAFKIEALNESRSNAEDGSISKTELTIWYSPDVRRFVKQEIRVIANGRVRNKTLLELTDCSMCQHQKRLELNEKKANDTTAP